MKSYDAIVKAIKEMDHFSYAFNKMEKLSDEKIKQSIDRANRALDIKDKQLPSFKNATGYEIELLKAELEVFTTHHAKEKQACDLAVKLLLKVVGELPKHSKIAVNSGLEEIHSIRHGS